MIPKKLTAKALIYLFILTLFVSCKTDKKTEQKENLEEKKDNAIEIVTRSMEFQMVDTITSGWNTFRFKNLSNETHFFLMDKYPEGKTIEDLKKEIFSPFDNGMDLINQGKPEEGFAEFNKLPKWLFDVVYYGGSGLIAPKHIAETTIKLDPGYYVMECYVKMPNGKFHASMGMVKAIIITEEDSGNSPPTADVGITISKDEGISYSGNLTKGEHTLSVHFIDQAPHEHFLGHDVNLVKFGDDVDLEKLEAWMNWSTPFGLKTPVPQGVTFLGGVNDSPAGTTGYFTVNLSPGNYAFISEVPNASKKGMLKTFTIQ
jgi:hypothetical protein